MQIRFKIPHLLCAQQPFNTHFSQLEGEKNSKLFFYAHNIEYVHHNHHHTCCVFDCSFCCAIFCRFHTHKRPSLTIYQNHSVCFNFKRISRAIIFYLYNFRVTKLPSRNFFSKKTKRIFIRK